jgi:multidrug efflux pump subunit AcrA (membrane-fusion protein)
MSRPHARIIPVLVVLCTFGAAAAFAYYRWRSQEVAAAPAPEEHAHEHGHSHDAPAHPEEHGDEGPHVHLSQQARNNLGLVVQPLEAKNYWRKIELPGVLTDRPGVSDRSVTAPVTGIVTQIHSHLGETVRPGAPLFVLRLTSESLHTSQRELFKATRELEIHREQRERLQALAQDGALSRSRIIEIDNQMQLLDVTLQAYRQDLRARGLANDQIAAAAKGDFVTEITVHAPSAEAMGLEPVALESVALASATDREEAPDQPFGFEFQELNVALGEQAEAGQVLCHLADHRSLLIEGRGFKEDMPLIQQAAKRGMPIELEFDERAGLAWPDAPRRLQIHHVENSIDTQTRTFGFHLVLENQWQTYRRGEHTGLLWRFRPGDRVRLRVAVEQFEDVFVLPQAAVVREGPEAYVFVQEGDDFHRRPVHMLAEDRQNVILASDEALKSELSVAVNAAASLNRVLKAQLSSGPAAHVHADGTVHEQH